MDSKVLFAAVALALGGYFIYKRKMEEEEDTNNANEATADINDADAYAALLFKKALDYQKDFGVWHGRNVDTVASQAELYNACLNVRNWAGVQRKFSVLCNNEATLLQAMQDNTDTAVYNMALQLIRQKKVITTEPVRASIKYYYENGTEAESGELVTFQAGTLIGAYLVNNGGQVAFLNGFKSDGGFFSPEMLAAKSWADSTKVQIINPV